MSQSPLHLLASALETLPDPRSKQGVTHPYHGMLALVLLGLIAQMPYVAEIRRWAKRYWYILREPLKFKRTYPPVETTIFRALAKTTVADFQNVFGEFLKIILADEPDAGIVAVDGKVAKNMLDADGEPLLLLNIFIHELKVALTDYSVHGDKTNEPGCLKAHLESLFAQYPFLKLLTGDAIFAQRPLLAVLQEHGCDYLFQVKENQPDILDAAKVCFAEAETKKPDDQVVEKRGQTSKCERSGATRKMRIMSVKC